MGKYVLVVMSDPVPGAEQAYNRWYSNEHLPDVVSIPGFEAARRFKLSQVVAGSFGNQYMALYEMSDDDPLITLAALQESCDSGQMRISEALDTAGVRCAVFKACASADCDTST